MEHISNYEKQYKQLVEKILSQGETKLTRNGKTISLFGESLEFNLSNGYFPLLTGRKMYYKGIIGELAAMLRGPEYIQDFEKFGCNYWKLWAQEDGFINVDYGNKWIDWDGVNQLDKLIKTLKTDPNNRRMIISGWDPTSIDSLDLPCCHYAYQWYVRDDQYLDMLWNQRSADTMIGLPSDAVFAAAWNIAIANEVGLIPGKVKMILGDVHIYNEHVENAFQYLSSETYLPPTYIFSTRFPNQRTIDFIPDNLIIKGYKPQSNLKFELKS
jgi:thymidylate synthase